MKKIILAAIAGAMLLSNIVFASTKTDISKNITIYVSQQNSAIHIDMVDPSSW